eukprot:TCONS_00015355-protein
MSSLVGKCIMQQCLSAKLMVKPAEGDDSPAQYVQINQGVVVFICFLKDAAIDHLPKIVKSILEVRLSFSEENQKRVSILDLPGDVLIVPQATLGGRMKGKAIQYHNNVSKELGQQLYSDFVAQIKESFEKNRTSKPNDCVVHSGTYGNLQVLNMETNGPYTTILEF